MNDEGLIATLPLERTWLADIVDVLMNRPDGTGEVEAIKLGIMRSGREMGKEPDATITRRINDYCRNARDEKRRPKYELFERVGEARYKLISWPNRPDLLEIQAVRFTSKPHQMVWEYLNNDLNKNDERWKSLPKNERLLMFSELITPGNRLGDLLIEYQNIFDNPKAHLDLF